MKLGEEFGAARQKMLTTLEEIFTFLSQNESIDRLDYIKRYYLEVAFVIIYSNFVSEV